MKKIALILGLALAIIACDKDDDTASPSSSNNSGNTNNTDTTTTTFDNSYMFSDDMTECFPHTSNPSINGNGILNVVSQPCSNSGSKLDGYFKWNYRPAPGTYQVVGSIGTVPYSPQMNQNEFAMVFYGHGQSTLYSLGGTVEVSTNATDTSLLDLNWKDIQMGYAHDSSTVNFSGNLKGL